MDAILKEWKDSDEEKWVLVISAALAELKKIGEEYLNGMTSGILGDYISHNLDVERTFALLKRLDLCRNHRSVSNLENAILYNENIIKSEHGRAFLANLTPGDHRRIRKLSRALGPLQASEK